MEEELLDQFLFAHAEQGVHEEVQAEAAREVVAHEPEHDRHEHHDLLLRGHLRVGRARREVRLEEPGDGHHDGEQVEGVERERRDEDVDVHRRPGEQVVGLREVLHPEDEGLAAQLDGELEDAVHADEDRQLKDERQAARGWVHAVIFVQTHDLLIHLLLIVFVLLPNFLHHGLKSLHFFH